jgi:hypothetical protein
VFVALALPLAIPLFLASVRDQPEFGTVTRGAMVPLPPPQLKYEDLTRPYEPELPEHSLVLSLEKNDTLDDLLGAGGLSHSDGHQLAGEIARSVDVRKLRPGQMVRFHYDRMGVVDAVQMKVTGWGELVAKRNAGRFDVSAHPAVLRQVEATVAATIDYSLYEALRDAGEGPQLVQQLIDVFQWDIDFFQLQRGDSFSVVVTRQYAGDDLVGYAPVTAARFVHNGNVYAAFRHEAKDGRGGY